MSLLLLIASSDSLQLSLISVSLRYGFLQQPLELHVTVTLHHMMRHVTPHLLYGLLPLHEDVHLLVSGLARPQLLLHTRLEVRQLDLLAKEVIDLVSVADLPGAGGRGLF